MELGAAPQNIRIAPQQCDHAVLRVLPAPMPNPSGVCNLPEGSTLGDLNVAGLPLLDEDIDVVVHVSCDTPFVSTYLCQ